MNVGTLSYSVHGYCLQLAIASHTHIYTVAKTSSLTEYNEPSSYQSNTN
jgi:hypothetical protein